MKIALIDPNQNFWETGRYCRHSQLEPIGLEYIGAIVVDDGYPVKIFHQINENNEKLISDVINYKPDIIGFSTYTYTFNIICYFADILKRKLPETVIVAGGHHITASPEDIIDTEIDIGVYGEGDETFLELVHTLENNLSLKQIPGIVFKNRGRIFKTESRSRIRNLDKLPTPLRNWKILNYSKVKSAVYPPASQQRSVAQVITSRGCINNCSYCCSPQMWKKKLILRSPENIADEFEFLHKEFGTNLIHVSDLSVNLNRDHLFKMCHSIEKRDLDVYWTACGNIDNIDEEMIIALAKAKCKRIAFGIESLSKKTINKIKPKQNNNLNKMIKILEIVRNYGLFARGFFMIGYPWETIEDLNELSKYMNLLPLDDIRISFLTPFPGTRIYDKYREKGLIQNYDYKNYTSEIPLIKNKYLNNTDYIKIRERLFNNFYLSNSYYQRIQKQIYRFPEYRIVYEELFNYLRLPVLNKLSKIDTFSKNLIFEMNDNNKQNQANADL